MRKKILILFFIFINLVLSKDNDVIPFHNELSEAVKGSIIGGTNVILNSKSYAKEEFELYFKIYPYPVQSLDETNQTRKEFEQMFDRNYLNKYYSNIYIELKNGEKFLYGKFYRVTNYTYYVLELYFVDKNNELKTKIYYKESKDTKGYGYLKTINEGEGEAYFYVPFIPEEITLITENKKMQLRKGYFATEGEFYEYLLDLFKEEIPKEFFELRKVKRYEEVYTGPDHFVPNQKKD